MAGWATGSFGSGSWGGETTTLNLIREFESRTSNPNEISLTWRKPSDYDTSQELVITRRKDSFPMELFNDDPLFTAKQLVSGFTDPVQVEIFRGILIRGSGTGDIGELEDTSAIFPTSPSLKGRILRDSLSHNFKIISNTTTKIVVDGTPATGQYVVLVDFPNSNNSAVSGITTSAGPSHIIDATQNFEPGSLIDRILVDSVGASFVIFNNSEDTITVSGTPIAGNYTILQEFVDFISPSQTVRGQFSYVDNYLNKDEATVRTGTGLEDEQFYYYTAFSQKLGKNIAQSVFATIDNAASTQAAALSTKSRDFQQILLDFWPNVFKIADTTGDFSDLMNVFGFGINELYSFVNTFDLSNPDSMFHTILPDMAKQTGIQIADTQLGIDTLRRIIAHMLPTWKIKGSKQGIVNFIRVITTWDATNGTGDPSVIIDDIPNSGALRFYADSLGSDNTRLFGFKPIYLNDSPFVTYTYTPATGIIEYSSGIVEIAGLNLSSSDFFFEDGVGNLFDITEAISSTQIRIDISQTIDTSDKGNVFQKTEIAAAGRFFTSLPGIVIPGFFDFNEFVVEIQNVALFVGESSNVQVVGDTTIMTDSTASFGGVNNLVGNFLLPKQGQVNDIFEIISNTSTTITVRGVVRDQENIGDYAILSPLNVARFQRLITLMREYAPSFTRMGLQFT